MKYVPIIISGIIMASFAAEEHNSSNLDNFYREKCYIEGLSAIKNYETREAIESGFNVAYSKLKCAEELGHIGAIHHLGYLYELAVQDLYGVKVLLHENGVRLTDKELLSRASHYYALAIQHNLPGSEEAYCRVMRCTKILLGKISGM